MRAYKYMLGMGRVMVLAFLILLVVAVVSEARGDSASAEYYSLYAYYFLVAGVIMILVGSIREGRGSS